MLERCSECGKRDWRVGYYLRWLFNPVRCCECGKLYWCASRRNAHVLGKHPKSMTAAFIRGFDQWPRLTPLTVLMEKMSGGEQ